MTVSLRHARHLVRNLPVAASLGGSAVAPCARSRDAKVERTFAPIGARLVDDYVAHVGGIARAYRGIVPPHLFPRWGLALAGSMIAGHYPLSRALVAGCRLESRAPLPADAPLRARAEWIDADDDGRRALLSVRVVTGTAEAPDALDAIVRFLVPAAGPKRPRARTEVPLDAQELARWRLDEHAGLTFGMLTGDLNPIHWSRRAAVAAGFGGTILHGFSMFARAIEGVIAARFCGDVARAGVWDARFVRPLRVPADVALFGGDANAWIGDATGGAAYLAMEWRA